MQYFRLSEKIADWLLDSVSFRLHGFSVAFDVQIRNVYLCGKALTGEKYAPLLVCDGDRVLCGIALSYDDAPCYNSDMQGLPYAQLFITGNALPMDFADESWLDYVPEESLERLLASVNRIVIPQVLRENSRQEYRLKTLLPEDAAPSLKGNCDQILHAKYLLMDNGFPTAYGRAHGLFACWGTDTEGKRFSQVRISWDATEAFQSVAEACSKKNAIRSLADRKRQMVSAEEGHSLSFSLENLRGMPMRTLLQDKKEIMHNLERALSVCRVLLPDEEIPDADPTYGQVLHLLQRMRGGFGKDPAIDDWDSSRKRKVSESILLVFAELFMPRKADKNADPKATVSISRQSLRQRLLNVSLDTEQLANTPLSAYYQAMSVWTDSSYPNWIYKTQIRPLFEKSGKPESEHTLRLLAAYCQLSYEEKEVNDWKETFPLLYCLLLPESFS